MRGDVTRHTRTPTRSQRSRALDEILPALLDRIIEGADAAVIVTDTDGRILLWNDAAERTYGWSAAEAMGESANELLAPMPDRAVDGPTMCRRRNGSPVPVEVTDVPVLDDDGTVRAFVGISRDLTERFAADADARSLRAVADASSDAILTVADGRITSWGAAAQRLLGWTADEAVGGEIWSIVPDDLRQEAAELLERVAAGEVVTDMITECVARDGTRLPVSLDIAPVFDGSSQRWVGVVTMRDRRNRDEIVEAALVAEVQSRLLLQQATETVYVLEADATLRVSSSAVGNVLGFSPDDLVGHHATLLIHPDDMAKAMEAFDLAVSGAVEHPQVMYRRMTASGRWSWAEATLTNLLDDPVVGGVVVNVRDVTEREQALAGVMEREARLSAVISRSSDVAMFFDRSGTIGWVSPAITEALGMEPETLLGTSAIDLVHPDDRAEALRTFSEWLASPADHVRAEFRFLDADGDVRWVEQVATDLIDDPSVGYIVANLRDVTDRRQAHDELARLALVDDLTELPNRNALREMAATALAQSTDARCCSIIFFDLDDFSDVNDALGHLAGDELLISIARRVGAALPAGATLTRFGGDQFAILCEGLADLPECLAVAGLVQSTMAAPFMIDRKEVFAVASVGIALSPPDDVDALLRRADVALNRAKRAGRGQTVVFERKQGAEVVRRLHYAAEVRHAIASDEIVPHYQPVVDLATGRVTAVEALARWTHPELGPVSPDVFIPVAESSGLIGELGRKILDRACRDAAMWATPTATREGRRLQVAVNASAVQVMDRTFPDQVAAALEATGLDPTQLTIEVTETAALRDLSLASATLSALRDQGIDLSLDDFGTGYSSLSLLKRLPVSALKIDRSFVSGLGASKEDLQIVTGVVGLALALGFAVVAEGVETEEQAEMLADMGCHFGQGWLWSPAVPASDLLTTVERLES